MNNPILRAAALAAILVLPSTLDATPTFTPNSVKYSDSGIPNATGRDGGASIEARALLGKEGTTTLDVTAGGGTLDHVQVKTAAGTSNFGNIDAARFTTSLTGLIRGETVGVQATVDTGSRVGIINVQETVKLRPDLAVVQLLVPGEALPGFKTNITANVRELNGDVGARANCVLRIDGAAVDEANGIWVDAGSGVSCAFLYTFATAGTYDVSVELTGVDPGDWDEANNMQSAAITVTNPTEFASWNAWARQEFTDHYSQSVSQYFRDENTTSGWQTNMRFDAVIPSAIDTFEFGMSIVEKTDGTTIIEVPAERWFGFGGNCSELFGRSSFGMACVQDGVTNIFFVRNAAFATYLSRGWYRAQNPDGTVTEYLYYEYEMEDIPWGRQVQYGNTVELQFVASDGSGTIWMAEPLIELEPYDLGTTETTTCYPWGSCLYERKHVWGSEGTDSTEQ